MDTALSKFSQLGCEIFEGEKIHVRRMSAETEHHMRVLNLKYDMVSDCELPDTSGWCKINLTGPELIMADVRKFLSSASRQVHRIFGRLLLRMLTKDHLF